jgi:hypothetical protein
MGALSDERTGLSFTIAAGPRQRSHFRVYILLSQIRDFPFRRLLCLAGLRWRYSIPPPHGISVKFTLRLAVYRQSVRLGVKLLETHDQTFFPTELLR